MKLVGRQPRVSRPGQRPLPISWRVATTTTTHCLPIMASQSRSLAPYLSWRAHAPRWCRFVRTLLVAAATASLVVVVVYGDDDGATTTTTAAAASGGGSGAAGSTGGQRQEVPAIFMFGDSIVDPGNNNHRLTEAKANFPPYGQDFPGGVATGRFSNGLVPGDFIVSKLGIKDLLPPFIGPDLQLNDLLTGVVFACGGSGYDPLTSTLATTLSSDDQLALFQEYKEKLTALAGKKEMTRVISQGAFFIVMGSNDIVNNYFSPIPLRRHQYDLSSYVDFIVSSAINFTKTLNDMGAKKIGFLGVPPLGCCPSQITLGGSSSRQCEPLRNQASELYNSRVSKAIEQLNAERSTSGSKIVYFDIYYKLLDLIQNPASYGFKDVSEGCCGSTTLSAAIFIAYHSACPNTIDYVFWDGFHPTEKAYKIIADKLIQEGSKYLMM